MQQQQEVKPGDRLTIHSLRGRPELNNQSAILVGPAQGGRVQVRLDSGEVLALKQENLGIGAPSGGSGMPGFGGGMPGGMPGMPGMPAMPDVSAMAEQLTAALQQRLAQAGISLPPSVSPQQALMGFGIAAIVVLYILSRFLTTTALLIVGVVAYWGLSSVNGRTTLSRGSAKASQVLRRPVHPNVLLILLCIAAAYAGHLFFSSRSGADQSAYSSYADSSDPVREAIHKAYQQGHDDGAAGLEARPPAHISVVHPSPDSGKSAQDATSGFGLRTLLRYAPAAYFIYNLGKTPGGWDPQFAMMNAKANPVQAIMVLTMMSGMLF